MTGTKRPLTAIREKEKVETQALAQQAAVKKEQEIKALASQILTNKQRSAQENNTMVLKILEQQIKTLRQQAISYLKNDMLLDKYASDSEKNGEYGKQKAQAYRNLKLFLNCFEELNCFNTNAERVNQFIIYIENIQKELADAVLKAGGSHKGGRIGAAVNGNKIKALKDNLYRLHLYLQGKEATKHIHASSLKHTPSKYYTSAVPRSNPDTEPGPQRHVQFSDGADHKHSKSTTKNGR